MLNVTAYIRSMPEIFEPNKLVHFRFVPTLNAFNATVRTTKGEDQDIILSYSDVSQGVINNDIRERIQKRLTFEGLGC